ncbi:MAG: alpha/beta fold hydrolase [Thermoanaerobaculia bacterium]
MAESHQVDLPPYRFWESRAGTGTPVVLIHGLGGSSDWWRYTIPALEKTHTVAAVDLIGFGRNRFFLRKSSLPLSFGQLAALMVRWIETSFDRPVHLAGNSMGGHVAIHIAALRPDLIRSLVLVDSSGIPFELKPGMHLENIVVPRGMLSFARVLARDAFRSGPTAITVAFARLLRDDARPMMRTLKMPVLLLWGDRDPLVPLPYAEKIRKEIPQAKLVVVPRAGHVPMWENPEVFNRELLQFIDEVDASDAGQPLQTRSIFSWPFVDLVDGMAFREAGHRRDIVLVHGLGMSSAYFLPFARALFDRGIDAMGVDLPGFGESANAPAGSAQEHAAVLARWADAVGVRDAVWLGHSTGCNAVAHLATLRPDLVHRAVYVSPVWSERRTIVRRLFELLRDSFREPWRLFVAVVAAYWRVGLARWLGTFVRLVPDIRRLPKNAASPIVIAGRRDPLADREASLMIDANARFDVPGAHAVHFSHPEETADAVVARLATNGEGSGAPLQ